MNKITADHLARRACVYVRQPTPDQVRRNLESQRRQYALVDRARALGWEDVDVIDDDLGVSGSGTQRPGFERLLRALCNEQVGAVFSVEASRLARNGRDWHTLLGVLQRRRRAADRRGNRVRPQAHERSIVAGHEGHRGCHRGS
jgi:DNA invertase Pin-like site-specific DNA recombinase